MSLELEDMKYLSVLAKLEPSEENLQLYAGQCATIVDYFNELSQVDTQNVEPLYTPVEHAILFREDVPHAKRTREEVLLNAPQSDGAYFIVPKIVEGK